MQFTNANGSRRSASGLGAQNGKVNVAGEIRGSVGKSIASGISNSNILNNNNNAAGNKSNRSANRTSQSGGGNNLQTFGDEGPGPVGTSLRYQTGGMGPGGQKNVMNPGSEMNTHDGSNSQSSSSTERGSTTGLDKDGKEYRAAKRNKTYGSGGAHKSTSSGEERLRLTEEEYIMVARDIMSKPPFSGYLKYHLPLRYAARCEEVRWQWADQHTGKLVYKELIGGGRNSDLEYD